ncbi:MAG: hypothetical protein WA857_08745 [Candidatus Acidiferrum sp.]
MNKRMVFSVGVFLFGVVPLLAQDGESKKIVSCAGTISEDGQSFTCAKDHHVWKISDPASVRDMEGHQAKLTYHRTYNKDEIFVTSASEEQAPQAVARTTAPPTPHR